MYFLVSKLCLRVHLSTPEYNVNKTIIQRVVPGTDHPALTEGQTMKILILIAVSAVTLALGCTASPATSPDAATPNIEATVAAAIQMAIPNPTAAPTPNIDATVEAKLRATLEAAPTQMPTATPFPTPTLSALVELVRPSVVRIETDSGMGLASLSQSDLLQVQATKRRW